MVRVLGAVLGVILAAILVGCTATTAGVALKAPTKPGDAIVALMDTGRYPTAAGPPPGNADSDQGEANAAEARRMAQYVVGPWQVDATMVDQDFFATFPLAVPPNLGVALDYPLDVRRPWTRPLEDIGAKHGFIAGFSTGRVGDRSVQRLQHAVLRFPDPESAAAAANEMTAVTASDLLEPVSWSPRPKFAPRVLHPSWQPGACARWSSGPVHPDFAASASAEGQAVTRAFTAHGSYVLYQFVIATTIVEACQKVIETLTKQEALIDQFVPTDPAKLADLPRDPSGRLWARTLRTSDDRAPWSEGVWDANAWLHFHADPAKTAALFTAAGVDWVSQRWDTVYQARDPAGAARVVDQFTAETAAVSGVTPGCRQSREVRV